VTTGDCRSGGDLLAVGRGPRPFLVPFDGELVICDGPMLVAIAATGRAIDGCRASCRRSPICRPLASRYGRCGSPGSPAPMLPTKRLRKSARLTRQTPWCAKRCLGIDALSRAWAEAGMSEVAARSAGTSFVTAMHPRVPLLTHRSVHTRSAMARNGRHGPLPMPMLLIARICRSIWRLFAGDFQTNRSRKCGKRDLFVSFGEHVRLFSVVH